MVSDRCDSRPRKLAAGNGAVLRKSSVFRGVRRSTVTGRKLGRFEPDYICDFCIESITLRKRPGSVRHAEVPGSNPGSPTRQSPVRWLHSFQPLAPAGG